MSSDVDHPPSIRDIRYIVNSEKLKSIDKDELNLPPMCQGFWSLNTHNQMLTTPSDTLLTSYFPLLIGPVFTPLRRRDLVRLCCCVTFWVIIAQIVLFSYTLVITKSPLNNLVVNNDIIINMGGAVTSKIINKKEYWRFFTNIFLHRSFPHLLINIMLEMIFVMGRETSWNSLRLSIIFILSSIVGTIISLLTNNNSIVVGSSAAIFGIFGAFVSHYLIIVDKFPWRHKIGGLFSIALVIALLILTGEQNTQDNWGYALSCIFGACIGSIFFAHKAEKRNKKIVCYTLGGLFGFILFFVPFYIFIFQVNVPADSLSL